jgi:hypothetical protein
VIQLVDRALYAQSSALQYMVVGIFLHREVRVSLLARKVKLACNLINKRVLNQPNCNDAGKTRDPNMAWSHSEAYGSAWENRNLGSIDTYRSCTKGLQKTAYLHLGELPR